MKILSKDELGEKKNKFIQALPYFRLIGLLLILFVGLLGVKLYFTNLLATSGVRLTATTRKIEDLELKKAKLENEISLLGSISRLQKEAKKIGFEPSEKVEVLTQPEPLAQKP